MKFKLPDQTSEGAKITVSENTLFCMRDVQVYFMVTVKGLIYCFMQVRICILVEF